MRHCSIQQSDVRAVQRVLGHHTAGGGDREGSIGVDTGGLVRLGVPLRGLRGVVLRAQAESQAAQEAEGAAAADGEQRQHRAAQQQSDGR